MIFNVPQFVNIEDKIVGPLGWKELFWLIGMGVVLMVLWGFLDKSAFIIAAVPVSGAFLALAFYRPYGQPLIKVILFMITFFFRPKVYVWKREVSIQKKKVVQKTTAPTMTAPIGKTISQEEIVRLARILNTRSRNQ